MNLERSVDLIGECNLDLAVVSINTDEPEEIEITLSVSFWNEQFKIENMNFVPVVLHIFSNEYLLEAKGSSIEFNFPLSVLSPFVLWAENMDRRYKGADVVFYPRPVGSVSIETLRIVLRKANGE